MESIIWVLLISFFTSALCQGPYLVYGPPNGEQGSVFARPSHRYPPPAANNQPAYAEPAMPPMEHKDHYDMPSMNESFPEGEILTIDPRDPDGDSILGEAGKDYPTLSEIPLTAFQCAQQQYPGYYADQEAFCQVFHICLDDGRNHSFLCPNGTIFNQEVLVCDWWYNVNCSWSSILFDINAIFTRPMTTESTTYATEFNMTSSTNDTSVTEPTVTDLAMEPSSPPPPPPPVATFPPPLVPPVPPSYGPVPMPGEVYLNFGTRYPKSHYSQIQPSYQRPEEWSYSRFFNPDTDPEIEESLH